MRTSPTSITLPALALVLLLIFPFVVTGQQATLKFKLSPSTIPAGRTRTVKITTESAADLTGFEVEKPPEESGVVLEPGVRLSDGNAVIIARFAVDTDADSQTIPLILQRKGLAGAKEVYTVDLNISAYAPTTKQKEAVPAGLEYEVDAMFQPMSFEAAKDVFGRRVAKQYYAVVVSLGNNTGYDLQINKLGFRTTRSIKVPDLDRNGNAIYDDSGLPKLRNELLDVTAIDRSLVRSSIERDQSIGKRSLVLSLIGGVGTFATGFSPFFHAANPKANFASFTSLLNGQLKDGFTMGVPDLTIGHLNRLDSGLVMNQDFVLPNNSERNTVVFVPRSALDVSGKGREDLANVTSRLGKLIVVGRKINLFANRQLVVRSDRPSLEPEPFAAPKAVTQGPISIESVSPDAGSLSASTDVIITGTGFTPGTPVKVMFGDRQTTGVALTPTEVKATVPPNATAKPIDVQVMVADHNDKLEKGFAYVDELKIESVDPATGPAAGGVVVKVKGKGILSGATVMFGSVPAQVVSISNDHNVMMATLPAHAAGNVEVEVKNKSGAKARAPKPFTFNQ